jgi:hypothetical protein
MKEHSQNRKILVVGQGDPFPEAVMDYALQVSERLGFDLVAVSVSQDPEAAGPFLSSYRKYLEDDFTRRASVAAAIFGRKAQAQGLNFSHVVKFGELSQVVEQLPQEIKRVEFVLDASGDQNEHVCKNVNLPCFTLTGPQEMLPSQAKINEGGWTMRPIGKTVGWGIATAVVYAAAFWNTGTVMKYFTMGGWYAALPVATVFLVSFVHGAFTHNFWLALGVDAKKVVTTRPAAAKRPAKRQRPRPEIRLNA